jgi:uncharacterized repeat protein (TIGR01451 family)
MNRYLDVPPVRVLVSAIVVIAGLLVTGLPADPFAIVSAQSSGRSFYVSPAGQPTNDGTIARPLDLATALSTSSPARAGDVIWLRGGTYRGTFISHLTGTSTAPIIVRQYPGERATIDSAPTKVDALYVVGGWTWFWGFEVMNSDPLRVASTSQAPEIRRGGGITSHGPGTKFINLIVHDMLNGFGVWSTAPDAEIYGSLIYHNGYDAPDRGHGHGIYTQNRTGARLIAENILFAGFSHNIHAYGSSAADLNNIRLEGNVSFDAGALDESRNRNILIGGGAVAQNPVVLNNFTYFHPGRSGGENNLGLSGGCTNLKLERNYFAHFQAYPLALANCTGSIVNNRFIGWVDGPQMSQYPVNLYHSTPPTGVHTFVRPNRYERGRANITIYNWDLKPIVPVDLTPSGIPIGTAYEIRDAQNFFGPPVIRGTFDGSPVGIPMLGLIAVPPIGILPRTPPPHTAPGFGAFVLLPTTSDSPVTIETFAASNTNIQQGQSTELSWTVVNAAKVALSPGVGDVSLAGTRSVTPSATTTYQLTATNSSGVSVTKSVTVNVGGANATPTVTLVSPSPYSTVTAPATVTVTAAASDVDGTISAVSYYNGSNLLATTSTAPHTITLRDLPAGAYTLSARAYDNRAAMTTSPAVPIAVVDPSTGQMPDLVLSQTVLRSPIIALTNATYSIVVRNAGAATATGVTVTNVIPWRSWFISSATTMGQCRAATCTIGTLPPGGSATVTLVVKPMGVGNYTNAATVKGAFVDPTPGNNTAKTLVTVVY